MINEYFKRRLTYNKQKLYEKMLGEFSIQHDTVDCSGYADQDIVDAYMAIYNDHPELFFISNGCKLTKTGTFLGVVTSIVSTPIFPSWEIQQYYRKINEIKSSFQRKTIGVTSETEKELLVIDYLLEHTTYEINNMYNQNAGTVLVKNKGQCSGIAKAVKLMCDWMNIECLIVTGTGRNLADKTTGPHAWNIVKINGKYYHLDVTYMIGANMSKTKPFRYMYYNCSDTEFEKDHVWEKNQFPRCITASSGDPATKSGVNTRSTNVSASTSNYKQITSMFSFRNEIGKIIDNRGQSFTFISKVSFKDRNTMVNEYLAESVKIAKSKNLGVSINITAKGEEVTISIKYDKVDPNKTVTSNTRATSNSKVITSMFSFRNEIGRVINARERKFTFISKVNLQNSGNIGKVYLEETIKIAKSKNVAGSIDISIIGDEVTITFTWA